MTETRITFERETCMRCDGTGQYPSSAWNGVCLGCSGAGVKFTRNGRTAYIKYHEAVAADMAVLAENVIVGSRVFYDRKWWLVEANEPTKSGLVTEENLAIGLVRGVNKPSPKRMSYIAQVGQSLAVWNEEIYVAIARRIDRLKGATVTGLPEPELTEKSESVSSPTPVVKSVTKQNGRIDHTNCGHDRTPKARAACRRARG
jgi:hypothetical protein